MFEIYNDKRGDFRWRYVAANGRKLFACTEGYKNRADMLATLAIVWNGAPHEVKDLTTRNKK